MSQALVAEKRCSACNTCRPLELFGVDKRNKSTGRVSKCKHCVSEQRKNRAATDPAWMQSELEKRQSNYRNNKQSYVDRAVRWKSENQQKHRELARGYAKKRLAKFPDAVRASKRKYMAKPWRRIGRQVWGVLRNKKSGIPWPEILGYGSDELKSHLERQFVRGMRWDNYGEWHIDHIIPLSSFTIDGPDDPEIRRAWSLPNLRPLWAEENISKSSKRLTLL